MKSIRKETYKVSCGVVITYSRYQTKYHHNVLYFSLHPVLLSDPFILSSLFVSRSACFEKLTNLFVILFHYIFKQSTHYLWIIYSVSVVIVENSVVCILRKIMKFLRDAKSSVQTHTFDELISLITNLT